MILMLNMLIAMMAKTFDRIYESAMVDFQYHFIGNLLQMVDEPAVPPILRTLGVPWTLCSTCWRWISQRGRELPQSGRREGTQQAVLLRNSSFHAMHQEQQQRDAGLREAMLRVDVNGKPTDEDQCIGLLYESVTSFVSEHASDTQVQDGPLAETDSTQTFPNGYQAGDKSRHSDKGTEQDKGRHHGKARQIDSANGRVAQKGEASSGEELLGVGHPSSQMTHVHPPQHVFSKGSPIYVTASSYFKGFPCCKHTPGCLLTVRRQSLQPDFRRSQACPKEFVPRHFADFAGFSAVTCCVGKSK